MTTKKQPDAEKDDVLRIDLAHLEVDRAEHARLVRIWGEKLAHAEAAAKRAKRKVRLTKAELSKSVRSNPSKYGVVKVTEDSVEDVVVMMSTYKTDDEAYIVAELDRDIIKSMVISLNERGDAFTDIIKLHGQMYWAHPRADAEGRRAIDEASREELMKSVTSALDEE